jgi:hypothetical protein
MVGPLVVVDLDTVPAQEPVERRQVQPPDRNDGPPLRRYRMLNGKMGDVLQLMRTGIRYHLRLPAAAIAEHRHDWRGLPARDPGIETAIDEGMAWLGRAQDYSASDDGGVASDFSLLTGWGTSYPEITGYTIPTMLAYARLR